MNPLLSSCGQDHARRASGQGASRSGRQPVAPVSATGCRSSMSRFGRVFAIPALTVTISAGGAWPGGC
jgi:hypothetical protein